MKKQLQNFIKDNKMFLLNSFIPFFIFSILFLAFYSGIITYDGNFQWQQIESGLINDAHPFFSTFFMLILSKIYYSASTTILFEMFLFSVIWGYFCQNLCSKKNKVILIYTLIISLIPIIGIYHITLWKDIIYSSYLLLISVILYKGINTNYKYKIFDYLILGFSIAMVYSYRHNGKIVAVIIMLALFINYLKNRKKILFRKSFLIILLTFISCILIISIPKRVYLSKSFDANSSNNEETVSTLDNYMLWMMGSFITENKVTSNDLKILNNIIEINRWKEIYNPYLINGMDALNNANIKYLNKNLEKFHKLFIKYTFKCPTTIIRHYLNADALLINPFSMKITYVYVYSFSGWDIGNYNFGDTSYSKLPLLNRIYTKIINYTFLPVIRLFYQPALILYLSILLLFLLAKKVYGKKIFFIGLPMFANTISLLPINLAQDLRYVYINYLTFFVILLLFILNIKNILVKKDR